jgi:hypothetical protein
MELKIYRAKAEWNKSPLKEKELLFVEFPNCISSKTGTTFKWLPTHEQVKKLKEELDEVEKIWNTRN